MQTPCRKIPLANENERRTSQLANQEWLVTAGNGGYASGTLGFVPTRRHHGLLIVNRPAPRGRTLLLSQVREHVSHDRSASGQSLAGIQHQVEKPSVHGADCLESFELDRCRIGSGSRSVLNRARQSGR